MSNRIKSVQDVIDWQLCTGCGACAFAEPQRFIMKDAPAVGRRPDILPGAAPETGKGLECCPGHDLTRPPANQTPGIDDSLYKDWGPVLAVWEGYSTDKDIRWAGSSGGAATALAQFGLETGIADKVVHTGMSSTDKTVNETILSTSREELLRHAGSRYAPASPCDGMGQIRDSDSKGIFIGKPCDVAASRKAGAVDPDLEQNVAFRIAFFCAGVPSTSGNRALLKREGFSDFDRLETLSYRGEGWPGFWRARNKNADAQEMKKLTYAESWGFLQKYRQWRCYICPDHIGEFADIAVGDPWYREVKEGEAGKSLIVARTRKGMDMVLAAAAAGYITLETRDNSLLPRSQPNLLSIRTQIWSRLLAMRLFGAASPRFNGFYLFDVWLKKLSLHKKIRSFLATVKRVYTKRLNKPLRIQFQNSEDK